MGKEREEKIKSLSKELKRIKDLLPYKQLGIDYVSICALALELVEDIFGEDCRFPVDIATIVKELGINIVYQPLNMPRKEGKRHKHKMVGTIFKMTGIETSSQINILIDTESKQEEQRYALAHELVHYLIGCDNPFFISDYHLMPMLFKDMEEMIADIFAIFVLIPLPAFFDVFYGYIRAQNEPVQTSEWLRYLSIIANVSYEEVSIGYQNIRFVSAIIYRLKHEKTYLEELGEQVKEITDSDEMKAIVIKQFGKMMTRISDEMEAVLYA